MTMAFGGLGLLSIRRPFAEIFAVLMVKSDIRSILCLLVFGIILFVLAYLTNPSEASFRTYLTEQSFRHHLSRLDDTIDDDQDPQLTLNGTTYQNGHPLPSNNHSPFHFANRASVSLRTPKHVFHTFGVFTIAAIIPVAKVDRSERRGEDVSVISDSWFIGAFGRWWRGGVLETWYQDVIARSGDSESWSSGILGMKSRDMCGEYNSLPGLPFSTKNISSHTLSRGSPPRLRNRDKSSQRSGVNLSRSPSPPPIPKGASLPLHTVKGPLSPTVVLTPLPSVATQAQSAPTDQATPSGVGAFDQSPRAVDLLRQISQSQASTTDLRTQLADCEASAAQSRDTLQSDLDVLREQKRREDASRGDLKTRTKTLEDSKRAAETHKREADKRLKAAQLTKDDTLHRMDFLDKEIAQLQRQLVEDKSTLAEMREHVPEVRVELADALEQKKQEISVADEVVTSLGLRAKELEEEIAIQQQRLKLAHDYANNRREHELNSFTHLLHAGDLSAPQPYPLDSRETLPPSRMYEVTEETSPILSLGRTPATSMQLLGTNGAHTNGFGHEHPNDFASFNHGPISPAILSPFKSSSLIPAGLISADLESEGLTRSFMSESDIVMERDWYNGSGNHRVRGMVDEPIPVSPPIHRSFKDHDPFEMHILAQEQLRGSKNTVMDLQRAPMQPRKATSLDTTTATDDTDSSGDQHAAPRRWFSTSLKEKPRKGLNPDAKVFNLSKWSKSTSAIDPVSFDALNPNGFLNATVPASTSSTSSFLRAFAPSPAERQALKQALGGSTNNSLERLPSLSDVSSIPSSPSHLHMPLDHQQHTRDAAKIIPSWLQALPRIRKSNFSPWDDEDTGKSG